MRKIPKERDRRAMPFLKDETDLVGVIFSSLCIVVIALLSNTEEVVSIAAFVSAGAAFFSLASTLALVLLDKKARQSLKKPVLAATWVTANSVAFFFFDSSHLLFMALTIGSTLSVLVTGLVYYFSR